MTGVLDIMCCSWVAELPLQASLAEVMQEVRSGSVQFSRNTLGWWWPGGIMSCLQSWLGLDIQILQRYRLLDLPHLILGYATCLVGDWITEKVSFTFVGKYLATGSLDPWHGTIIICQAGGLAGPVAAGIIPCWSPLLPHLTSPHIFIVQTTL